MEASELLEITIKNQIKLESILKFCEDAAKCGDYEFVFFNYISTDIICELAKLGYRIKKNTDQIGKTIHIISWD